MNPNKTTLGLPGAIIIAGAIIAIAIIYTHKPATSTTTAVMNTNQPVEISGVVRVGEEVVVLPSMRRTKVKSIDLMKEVRGVLGRRLKLDGVAEATLGKNKSGHGADAVDWWRAGEIEKLIKYCIEDVKITRELYDYSLKNGHLKYTDLGTIKEIPLNTANWEQKQENAITFTLPF